MRSFIALAMSLVALVAFAACGSAEPQNETQDGPQDTTMIYPDSPGGEAPNGGGFVDPFEPLEPPSQGGDMPSTPDVVAIVDGEEIKGEEFDARLEVTKSSYQQQGKVLEGAQLEQLQQQVLQGLVQERLLLQEAAATGIEVTDADVEDQFQELVGQLGSEEGVYQAAEAQGIPREDLRDFLSDGLKIDLLLEDVVEEAGLEPPAEEEVQAMYDRLSQQYGDNLPPLAEIREDLVAELQDQQRQQIVQSFVRELEEDSDIEILF